LGKVVLEEMPNSSHIWRLADLSDKNCKDDQPRTLVAKFD